MGGFDEYRRRLQAAIKQLNAERRKNTEIIALDSFNRVRDRVTNTGASATGGTFEPYSPSYKKFKAETRNVAFRDFKFTNKMWNSIAPTFDGEANGVVRYVLASTDAENQRKIDENIARSGNFLYLSKSEIELLNELNHERFTKVLKSNDIA